jgi:intein-encoded DNA endonuclease-like protein
MGTMNLKTTNEEKLEIVKLYEQGHSTTKLSKMYGVYPNAINGILKRRNVKLRSSSEAHRKYWINETFFDAIDTEEKAYVLGLFYADGSNNIRRYKAYIMLSESDKDILLKIQKILQSQKPLLYVERKPKNPTHQNRYMLYIDNKHISTKLEELGCMTNKTYLVTFPKWLDLNLYRHFIRGYFDGDGHVGVYNRKGRFSIVGTESFCLSLQKTFFKQLNINSKLYNRWPNRKNNIRDLRVSGNKQILRILEWFYFESTIHMDRKFKKYLELKTVPKFKVGRKKINQ